MAASSQIQTVTRYRVTMMSSFLWTSEKRVISWMMYVSPTSGPYDVKKGIQSHFLLSGSTRYTRPRPSPWMSSNGIIRCTSKTGLAWNLSLLSTLSISHVTPALLWVGYVRTSRTLFSTHVSNADLPFVYNHYGTIKHRSRTLYTANAIRGVIRDLYHGDLVRSLLSLASQSTAFDIMYNG